MEAITTSSPAGLDRLFYREADEFFPANATVAMTYDDVSLATLYSEILPRDADITTELAPGLVLQLPVVSADMDTVTESRMAIALALSGGLGLIHYNMAERQQLSEVSRVKNHVHGLIREPIKVSPDEKIGDVLTMIEEKKFSFSTFPVVDGEGVLLGLLPRTLCATAFRGAGRPVIYTRHVHHPDFIDTGIMKWWWEGACLEGTPESEVADEIAPLKNEKVILKHRYSSFYNTDLETILRCLKIEDLVITGIMTNMCCESTARDAYYRDYRVFFLADATGSVTEEMHLASLLNLAFGFAYITTTGEILRGVETSVPAKAY
jgi:nicotinamidase-related amidase